MESYEGVEFLVVDGLGAEDEAEVDYLCGCAVDLLFLECVDGTWSEDTPSSLLLS